MSFCCQAEFDWCEAILVDRPSNLFLMIHVSKAEAGRDNGETSLFMVLLGLFISSPKCT